MKKLKEDLLQLITFETRSHKFKKYVVDYQYRRVTKYFELLPGFIEKLKVIKGKYHFHNFNKWSEVTHNFPTLILFKQMVPLNILLSI